MNFPIKSVGDLQKLTHAVQWQFFEKFVAWIFGQNDFEARQNIVMKAHA